MKVTIDIHRMVSEEKNGIVTYIQELSNNLIRRGHMEYDFAFFDKNRERGHRQIAKQLIDVSDEQLLECVDYKCSDLKDGSNFYTSFCEAINTKSDIVHLASFIGAYPHIVKERSIPIVLTVHDIFGYFNYEHTKKLSSGQYFRMTSLLNNVLSSYNNVVQIITDSDYTKRCLCELFPQFVNRIRTIHISYNENVFYPCNSFPEIIREKSSPYFLQVGRLCVDKNVFGTIAAFFSLCEKYDDIKLVLIGKPVEKFFDELFKKFDSNHFIKRIDFFTNVNSSDELREFYSNSVALVFPSFHEGFGIPIIEAQACGCPVITSNTTACPEVAGDGAVLVAPYSVDAIADGMERILNDSQLRQDLIRKGYENIKRFSWDKVAAMTEEVYKLACEVSR